MTNENIVIRPVQTHAEVLQIEEIQLATWGNDERSIMPYNLIHALIHAEGIVLGAFEGAKMVGFVASFLGKVAGQVAHWSHMAAVLPSHRRQGIARQLKFAQREAALQQGITLIAWTFDPLRHENAVFNLESLGVECHVLHHEIYGQMTDELNVGLLSDRFEAHWHLTDKRVKLLAKGQKAPFTPSPETYVTLCDKDNPQIQLPDRFDQACYALAVPIAAIRANAQAWYLAIRAAAHPLFGAGYRIERVHSTTASFAYLFQRPETWYLYVLETADGTLYTGVSNNLEKRLLAHNNGKGASYTATRRPVKLMGAWVVYGKGQALRLEKQFKKLSRAQKLASLHNQTAFTGAQRHF